MDISKLKKEQLNLAKKIITKDSFDKLEFIAGCDQAFFKNEIVSAIVLCDYNSMKQVERVYSIMDAKFPYISGYRSYREAPVVIKAYSKLTKEPDVLIIQAHGILHPRRIGMASHIGLLMNKPTIGIAKGLLCGEVKEGKVYVDKELRGMELQTRDFSKPVYVSPGNKISLNTAVEIVKRCIRFPHKLPEPLHLAHKYAKKVRDAELKKKVIQ